MSDAWHRFLDWMRESFDRPTVLRLSTIALLTLACLLALDRMRRRSLHLERHLVRGERVRFLAAPDWVNPQILGSIRSAAPSVLSIFSPDLHDRVRSAFAASAWVEGVVEGERVYPDKVEVSLRLRKPLLLVKIDGASPRYYLVDRSGRRLPGFLAEPPSRFPYPLPVLHGVRGRAPARPGESFEDPSVALGARLALDLYEWHNSELYPEIRVQEIDLANLGGRENPTASEVVLRTSAGVPVHWGRARRAVAVLGEATVADKIGMVRKALRTYPGLRGVAAVKLHLGELLVELDESASPEETG